MRASARGWPRNGPAGYGSVYWRLTAWFWLGYAAWFANGLFGHDFYRIWWLALAMSHLGSHVGGRVQRAGTACPARADTAPHRLPPRRGRRVGLVLVKLVRGRAARGRCALRARARSSSRAASLVRMRP